MDRVKTEEYSRYIRYAEACTANRVYPLSIASGIREGDICTDGAGSVLFWHCCGFAYIPEPVSDRFLEEVYHQFLLGDTDRRFLLITDSEHIRAYYAACDKLQFSRRVEYTHSGILKQPADPDGHFSIERITADNIGRIRGRIIPSVFWGCDHAFLERGFGFIARKDDGFAALAFSAAVSPDEADIGVETCEDFRHNGLASYLSFRMCEEIIRQGRRPVWAHGETNEASRRTALRAGFVPDRVNTVIRRKTG
ncbi:MAG: GNAT family N-acetyltransferase [Solobacterium sp.]|nr:GNAT family N-acetyltransferase [Solobacterium sp.]